MNFLVHVPCPYTHLSAGVKVLYYLCHLINLSGYNCYITYQGNVNWINPIYNNEQIDFHIYPEIYKNTKKSDGNIIRWCLNVPGKLGGESFYPEHEMIWYYCDKIKNEVQQSTTQNLNNRQLFLPSLDKDLYSQKYIKSIPVSCYIGKGNQLTTHLKIPYENIPTITSTYPFKKEETIALLQSSKLFYSYDDFSIINVEALICGCKVYIVENLKWKRFIYSDIEKEYMNLKNDLKKVNYFIDNLRNEFSTNF